MSAGRKTTKAAPEREAIPFAIETDEGFQLDDDGPRPLIVNPAASVVAILDAADRRAHYLRENLFNWACSGNHVDGTVTVADVAAALEAYAAEVETLIHAARLRALMDAKTARKGGQS